MTPVCKFLTQNSKYKWPKVFAELFDMSKISTKRPNKCQPIEIWSEIVWLFGGLRCSNVSSTNHQLILNPYHRPFMV